MPAPPRGWDFHYAVQSVRGGQQQARDLRCKARLHRRAGGGRRAEQIYSEHDVELWDGDRLVAVFRGAASNIQAMG